MEDKIIIESVCDHKRDENIPTIRKLTSAAIN